MTGYDRERAEPVIRWKWVLIGIIAAILLVMVTRARAQEATVYTLAFSACQDAAHCERHEVGVDSCLAAGLPFLARWEAEHPGWSVVHWTCAVGVPS